MKHYWEKLKYTDPVYEIDTEQSHVTMQDLCIHLPRKASQQQTIKLIFGYMRDILGHNRLREDQIEIVHTSCNEVNTHGCMTHIRVKITQDIKTIVIEPKPIRRRKIRRDKHGRLPR